MQPNVIAPRMSNPDVNGYHFRPLSAGPPTAIIRAIAELDREARALNERRRRNSSPPGHDSDGSGE